MSTPEKETATDMPETDKDQTPTGSDIGRQLLREDLRINGRNAVGHWGDCAYWDWADFSKCDCAEGLPIGGSSEPQAVVVAPIPLRDYFAAQLPISWDQAIELAQHLHAEKLNISGKLDVADIIEARVRIRYLEADAMCEYRALPPAEPEPEEPTAMDEGPHEGGPDPVDPEAADQP